ncbi:MAG: Gfo/Idh/MocA family oxidoreductase, partial [Candidatus Margulisbacteria bacterium]|nr:Gfo/Idh/MocA family oxidoreductase [Candidatus Margulisiibacteriota bacterium]
MHILILGYSNIVKKRVLPALANIALVSQIDVASRSAAAQVELPPTMNGLTFADYDEALANSKAEVVYISTLNPLHAGLAAKALARGFHVIVDKPAVTDFPDAQKLVDLAREHRRCLAESTVFSYHPQIALARQAFITAKSTPTRITAVFSFPPRAADDYRYKKSLGGGALFDVGPYAIAPGRLFFQAEPSEIRCQINDRGGEDGADIAFSLLAVYPGG